MSRIYEGDLLCAEGGSRAFTAKSMGVVPNLQNLPIGKIYYEKVAPNLGRELFTKKVFPVISVLEDKKGQKHYENNSIVDAAVVIQSDEEWGLIDDKDYLRDCLQDLMNDPQYECYLDLIHKACHLNQPLSEAIRERALCFGNLVKERVQAEMDVNTMGYFAKKMIKGRRK